MPVKFLPDEHKYVSVDPNESIHWTSVTSIISKFKEPFDADTIAKKSARNKKSKWYGMTPEQIKEEARIRKQKSRGKKREQLGEEEYKKLRANEIAEYRKKRTSNKLDDDVK